MMLQESPPLTLPSFPGLTDEQRQELESNDLGIYDVICGRHKAAFNNVGNRRFRITVSLTLDRYVSSATRKDKSNIIKSIAALVRSNGGRFLQRKKNSWVELTEKQTHEKVGHALRDMALGREKCQQNRLARNTSVGTQKNNKAPLASSSSQPPVPMIVVPTQQQQRPPATMAPMVVQQQPARIMQPTQPLQVPMVSQSSVIPSRQMPAMSPPPSQQQQQQQTLVNNNNDNNMQPSNDDDNNNFVTSVFQQFHRDSVSDDMLSWLVGESDNLLDEQQNGNNNAAFQSI